MRSFMRFSGRRNGKATALGGLGRTAGERARKTPPLDLYARLDRYAAQGYRIETLTPAQRRRIAHKAGRAGDIRARNAFAPGAVLFGGDR